MADRGLRSEQRPRWIVCSSTPLELGPAKLAVAQAFRRWPADDDVEVVADAPTLDGKVYVIDREAVERMPEDERVSETTRWLR